MAPTEEQWLEAQSIYAVDNASGEFDGEFLDPRLSRRLRIELICAYARQNILPILSPEFLQWAQENVENCERFLSLSTKDQLRVFSEWERGRGSFDVVSMHVTSIRGRWRDALTQLYNTGFAFAVPFSMQNTIQGRQDLFDWHVKQAETQMALLREILGNPFQCIPFDPAWRTQNVTAVARSIYEERRFADMPILGDALEEAGCLSDDLLAHCRGPNTHIRGCWALDMALGER